MIFRVLELYNDYIEPSDTKQKLWDSVKKILFAQGILHFNYSYSPKILGGACVKFRSWDSRWDLHYKNKNYHHHDELALYCAKGNVLPVYWNAPVLRPFYTKLSSKINGEALEFGIKGGLCCPLPPTGKLGSGIFNIVAVGDADITDLLSSWTEKDVQLFGGFIHLQMAKIVNSEPEISIQAPLTRRESQCLELVAKGKSTKEIADEISCSDRTVNYHVQNAMRKLGAVSRWKAVRLASDFR